MKRTRVVPVALNSGLFWPRRRFLRFPGRVVIEALPAIEPGLDRAAFMERLGAAIEGGTQALIEEARREGVTSPLLTPAGS
jgi:1-acyl-sn-glycerol-3-phosphate acyltransferase